MIQTNLLIDSNIQQRQITPMSRISRQSTDKQQLKQQIQILKEQVKKLKIDKLNQKIIYQQQNNKIKSIQHNPLLNQHIQHMPVVNQQRQNSKMLNKINTDSQRNLDKDLSIQQYNFNTNSNLQRQSNISYKRSQKELFDRKSYVNQDNNKELVNNKSEISNHSRQPMINFRVGRIVKNNQQYSQQKQNLHQSKTIQVKRNHQSQVFQINRLQNSRVNQNNSRYTQLNIKLDKNTKNNYYSRPSSKDKNIKIINDNKLSRLSKDNKNVQLQTHQMFRTMQSNHKLNHQQHDQQNLQNQLINNPIKQNNFLNDNDYQNEQINYNQSINSKIKSKQQSKRSSIKQPTINFNQTIQSAELFLPQNKNLSHQYKINTDIKTKRQFSKSTNFQIPSNFSRISNSKTDRIGYILVNPQFHQQQIGDLIKQKNINIRKVSYKLKKSNPSVNPQTLRKQQLLQQFIKNQQSNKNHLPINRYSNQQNLAQTNINYQNIKIDALGKKSFKSRFLSQSKNYAINIQQELKHKLRGKIIKNFGSPDIQYQEISPDQQDHIDPNQIPDKKFTISQLPYFAEKPHPKSNQDQIIDLTLSIARKLQTNSIKRQSLQGIIIKKFKNCLIFNIPQTNKKIIWYYEGRFYFGQGQKQGQQGYKSGQGLQFIPQKSFYKGQFYQNKKHGSGVLINSKGDIYEGQWYQGNQQGNGKLLQAQTNHIYEGQFKGGKFDGFGILQMTDNQIYKGTFIRNIKHGFGIETFKNGDKYKGQYQNGKFHGKGKYRWSNGNIYQGQFVMGLRTGPGKWKSSHQDADIFIGMYLNDKKHGLGKYIWQDGSVFEGNFQNDQKHGQGILTYKDGKVVHGRWQNNQLIDVMNVQSEQENNIKTFKGQGADKIRLIERSRNEIIKPKKLRNI